MANRRVMTPEQDAQALKMYNEGQSAALIARTLGIDGNVVERSLHRQGIGKLTRRGYRRYATPPEVSQRIAELYAGGASCETISAEVGLPWLVVNRRLKEMGIQLRPGGFRRGEEHHAWVGGRYVSDDGYVYIWLRPDDPFISMAEKGHGTAGGYILEHRLVMARHLGRPLRKDETVHHKNNQDRSNNALDNLQLRIGRHGKGAAFRCRSCGSYDIEALPIEPEHQ